MVFIQIPAYDKQQKFLIRLLSGAVMKSSEFLVFLDISKVSLRLDGTDLTVKNTLLALYVCITFFFKFFPALINLH